MRRPNLNNYFRAKIDQYVNGMMARTRAECPRDVSRIDGAVTDAKIVVTMCDGTTWTWTGGRYAERKVNGCYAPLMPKPLVEQS